MPELTDGKTILHDEDPQRDLWGGTAVRNGRKLSAIVLSVPGDKKWFRVRLEVTSTVPSNPLTGKVTFYLHDSFDAPVVSVPVRQGSAIFSVVAFGAFTVGAKVEESDGHTTELELDLSELRDAPKRFVES